MHPTPSRRQFLGLIAATPVFAGLATQALAGQDPVFQKKGLAIGGYDPVAYFTERKPVRGSADFTSTWNGATFRFASAENKSLFDGAPEAYAPQYGGYCAYAVSQGYTAKTDPDAWSVEGDKLYLNFSKRVRRIWLKDVPGHIAAGDKNWPDVLG